MSTRYKLYRDGRFFDLENDPAEEKPLAVADLNGPRATVAKQLEGALALYADARPAHLRQPIVTTKQTKKAKKQKKKR